MKTFGLKPHTADEGIIIEADTLHELFEAGLLGMNHFLKPDAQVDQGSNTPVKHDLSLQAKDTTNLIIDFLSEVLTYSFIDHGIFNTVDFEHLSYSTLEATIYGYSITEFDEEIKAVTYHQAEVGINQEGRWQTTIIFDI